MNELRELRMIALTGCGTRPMDVWQRFDDLTAKLSSLTSEVQIVEIGDFVGMLRFYATSSDETLTPMGQHYKEELVSAAKTFLAAVEPTGPKG